MLPTGHAELNAQSTMQFGLTDRATGWRLKHLVEFCMLKTESVSRATVYKLAE